MFFGRGFRPKSAQIIQSVAEAQAARDTALNAAPWNPVDEWNADTNTPTITAGVSGGVASGRGYDCTVPGTSSITGTSVVWGVGDAAVWNGSAWYRRPASSLGLSKATTLDNLRGAQLFSENLINYSEDLTQWSGTRSTATAEAGAYGPDEITQNVNRLTEDTTATASHFHDCPIFAITSGLSYTGEIYLKAGTRGYAQVSFSTGGRWAGSVSPSVVVNLATGAIVSQAGTIGLVEMRDAYNGWWRVSLTATPTSSGTTNLRVNLHNGTTTNYTGTSAYIFATQAQVAQVAHTIPYKKTTDRAYARSGLSTFTRSDRANKADKFAWIGAPIDYNFATMKITITNGYWYYDQNYYSVNLNRNTAETPTVEVTIPTDDTGSRMYAFFVHLPTKTYYCVHHGNWSTVPEDAFLVKVWRSAGVGLDDFPGKGITRAEFTAAISGFLSVGRQFATENLLSYPNDFSQWILTNRILTPVLDTVAGPDGLSLNGWKIIEDTTATASHFIDSQQIAVTAGLPYTESVYVHGGTRGWATFGFSTSGRWAGSVSPSITLNLSAGAITAASATVSASNIEAVGNGWYRVSLTATPTSTGLVNIRINLHNGTTTNYTGDGAKYIVLAKAQLSQSSTVLPHSGVGSQPAARAQVIPFTDADRAQLTFDPVKQRLIVAPVLYTVEGVELPIYKSSIISEYRGLDSMKVALIETDEANSNPPRYTYFAEHIRVKGTELKPVVSIGMSRGGTYRHYIAPMTVAKKTLAALTGLSVGVNMIGDSLTSFGIPSALKLYLSRLGVTMTSIGTIAETQNGSELCEGRPSWTFRNYIGADNIATSSLLTVTPPGLGGAQINPFLKLATAGDKTNFPDWCFRSTGADSELSYTTDPIKTGNFYIFDYANYLSANSLATPGVAIIALGTNDITEASTAGIAYTLLILEQMIRQMKTAVPAMKIVIVPNAVRGKSASADVYHIETAEWIERAIKKVTALQATITGLTVAGVWMHVNRDFNFPYGSPTATNPNNTAQVVAVTDTTHWGDSGRYEYANALSSCVANII